MNQSSAIHVFRRFLLNTLVISVASSILWFALPFRVYVETHSVVATGCFAGATTLFVVIPANDLLSMTLPWFWMPVGITLLGSVACRSRSRPCSAASSSASGAWAGRLYT